MSAALFGVGCLCLVLAALVFVQPLYSNRGLVIPIPTLNGESLSSAPAGEMCDNWLRVYLRIQKYVSDSSGMNELVRMIQRGRDGCAPEFWNPVVVDSTVDSRALMGPDWLAGTVHDVPAVGASHPACAVLPISGQFRVPWSLIPAGWAQPQLESGRGQDHSIIVYFDLSEPGRVPWDGAQCWFYIPSVNAWFIGR